MSGDMTTHLETRAVLFDFYNTLVDVRTDEHRPEVWEQLARFLRYHGLYIKGSELYSAFMKGADEAKRESAEKHFQTDIAAIFEDILMLVGAQDAATLKDEVMWAFRTLSMVHFELFPDTLATLEFLRTKSFKIGLVTDAQVLFVRPELQMLGLTGLLDVTVVSGARGIHKPDARLYHDAMDHLNLSPREVVFVGNNVERDILGAHHANIRSVLLDRDRCFELATAVCEPNVIIHSLTELRRMLVLGGSPAFA